MRLLPRGTAPSGDTLGLHHHRLNRRVPQVLEEAGGGCAWVDQGWGGRVGRHGEGATGREGVMGHPGLTRWGRVEGVRGAGRLWTPRRLVPAGGAQGGEQELCAAGGRCLEAGTIGTHATRRLASCAVFLDWV